MYLNKLNGWQRIWAVAAVIWLIPSAWITFQNFPLEQQVHEAATQMYMDAMHDRRERDQEIANHCSSTSSGDALAYLNCRLINEGMQGLSVDEREAARTQNDANFHKIIQEKKEYIVTTGLKQLLGNQVRVALQGLLIWGIPLLSSYALGLGIAWIRSGFKK